MAKKYTLHIRKDGEVIGIIEDEYNQKYIDDNNASISNIVFDDKHIEIYDREWKLRVRMNKD